MPNKLNTSNFLELSAILDKIAETGIDRETVNDFLDLRLKLRASTLHDNDEVRNMHKQAGEMERLKAPLRMLYETLSEAIAERKMDIYQGRKMVNMNQPKYKLSKCAEVLGVSRQQVNNWTNRKGGGFLMCYEREGFSKFVLESDLVDKYYDIHGKLFEIDDRFRYKYSYNVPI